MTCDMEPDPDESVAEDIEAINDEMNSAVGCAEAWEAMTELRE